MSLDSHLQFVEIRMMRVERDRQDLSFVNESHSLHNCDCRLKNKKKEDTCQLSSISLVKKAHLICLKYPSINQIKNSFA